MRGYGARIMRPAVIGAPSQEQSEAARALIEIQDRQIAAMKPGPIAADVDRIVREGVGAERLTRSALSYLRMLPLPLPL